MECGWGMPYIDLLLFLPITPWKSKTPRQSEYETPGRSLAPPPLTKTVECFFKLCPIPGICAVNLFLDVSLTLAVGLLAELGFLGVNIRTLAIDPLTWGHALSAGADFLGFFFHLL